MDMQKVHFDIEDRVRFLCAYYDTAFVYDIISSFLIILEFDVHQRYISWHNSCYRLLLRYKIYYEKNNLDDQIPIHPIIENNPLLAPQETILMSNHNDIFFEHHHLDKEFYSESQWLNEQIFRRSINKINYEPIDITKYVGDSQFKENGRTKDSRLYFDPNNSI